MFLGTHEAPLHIARSMFWVARNLWYSPAIHLVAARLFF
jgi:hypothetical protein